ncbi:MAG: transketolase C-terminal domain-containing protein [Pseudomonadota bacterium]
MSDVTYMEAGRLAVAAEMAADPTVWCVGEDLGRGGVFGQYKGLVDTFGPGRISDAPISEAAIMGVAVGAAMTGTRPVVEMRFSDFALCAIDELINQAAKARFMFGGQSTVPITVREPIGMWRSSAAQHSQSLEAWYTHIPGLVVVCPATPQDNYALLRAAIRCDDPVVFMEHKGLWPLTGPLDEGESVPLGKAVMRREGADLTIVTWSAMVHRAIEAADALAADGVSAAVIDLRTLWPWDRDLVLTSVEETGRALVVHEAVQVSGFGAEIVATIAEETGARVARLGAPRAPIAYAPTMEREVSVLAEDIAARARLLTV